MLSASEIEAIRKQGVKIDANGEVVVHWVAGPWCPYTGASLPLDSEVPTVEVEVHGTPLRLWLSPFTQRVMHKSNKQPGWQGCAYDGTKLPKRLGDTSRKGSLGYNVMRSVRGNNQRVPWTKLTEEDKNVLRDGHRLYMNGDVARYLYDVQRKGVLL